MPEVPGNRLCAHLSQDGGRNPGYRCRDEDTQFHDSPPKRQFQFLLGRLCVSHSAGTSVSEGQPKICKVSTMYPSHQPSGYDGRLLHQACHPC